MAKLNNYKLIVSKSPTYNERRAAAFIIEKIKIVTGYAIPVLTDDAPLFDCEIVVGATEREKALGVDFGRARERMLEYELRVVGKRMFVTGLGTSEEIFREPYSAYAPVNDFGLGTLYAAFRFCERVLGYDFSYVSDLESLVDRDAAELEIGAHLALCVSREKLLAERPVKFDGAAMYSVPATSNLDATRSCFIFKTEGGEFIVYDGGRREDAEHVLDVLEYLAGNTKPIVRAWLISQMRPSHSGVLCGICERAELSQRVEITDVYCRLMSKEFYTLAASKGEDTTALKRDRDIILNVGKYIGATLHTPENGDRIEVGEFSVDVIRSPKGALELAEKVKNVDSSVVYRLTYADRQSILLLGDGEKYTARELEEKLDVLKSDILQIGHHGRASVSEKCLRAIDADVYIAQTTNKIWYSDESTSARVSVYRTRRYLREMGKKRENVYRDTEGILSFKLPVEAGEVK